MKDNIYRIVTDGFEFRVEIFQSWTYRCGFLWLRKACQTQWVSCDAYGADACDDDGQLDESEIQYYATLEGAQDAIAKWKKTSSEPKWKVVWAERS